MSERVRACVYMCVCTPIKAKHLNGLLISFLVSLFSMVTDQEELVSLRGDDGPHSPVCMTWSDLG